jgi:dihydroflavonol-4-reductase
MQTVVTGASGHLGANLVRALLARGWKVRALVRSDTRALEGLDIETTTGDIRDADSLNRAFSGADAVFHLAARISVVKSDRDYVRAINVDGVRNVVGACRTAGIKRLVHTSTFHALRQYPLNETLDETRPLLDDGYYPPYDRSKAEGDRIVRQAVEEGMDAITIIPTGMIGPFDFKPSHFGAALLEIARGKLPALVNAGLDWVDVRDVAEGMIDACEKAGKGERYILGGHWVHLREIAGQVAAITGKKPRRPVLPLRLAKMCAPAATAIDHLRGKRPLFTTISMTELESNRNISHDKAARELGYRPRRFTETISDTIDWFIQNGMLAIE